jgi:hypothetical protein
MWASLPTKYLVSFGQSRATWDWKMPEYTAFPVNVVQVYNGQMGCSIDTRLKGHQWHICPEHLDKSAVAEHSINLGNSTQLHHTKPGHKDRIIKEATETELHLNMNMEDAFCLSKSWKPLICSLRDCMKPPTHDRRSGFFTGPHRSVCTALIREWIIASEHSRASTLMSRLPFTISSPTPCLQLTHLTSFLYVSVPCSTHPYICRPPPPPIFFLDQKNCPF